MAAEAGALPPDLVAVRYRNAAVELWVHGHQDGARDLAELGVAWIEARRLEEATPGSFMRAGDLDATQQLMYQKGRLLEVLGERRAALAIYEHLLAELPDSWFLRAHAGVLHASLGHISEAMQTDRWLQTLDVPYRRGDVTAWRAGLHAALGDRERANALVERALQQGMPWGELHGVLHLHQSLAEHRPWLRLMGPRG
jgi:tetratricopeptide (TPR) repeat protein